MKLVTFRRGDRERTGALVGDRLLDFFASEVHVGDLASFLARGSEGLDRATEAMSVERHWQGLTDIELLAPIPRPSKFLAVGLNYADHIAETGREAPRFPTIFNKQVSCINRPGGDIHKPRASEEVDYEGELAFVIGKRCRRVGRDEAREVIGGYTIVNDVSVRDWQRRSPTMTLGKGWDTHGPMGPCLVTADEIPDPHCLELRTWVNDELRQHSNTRHLLFDCFALVETLSEMCTLMPGDVVTTGTPSGVGLGQQPPRYLDVGDRVRIEIESIGVLENRVIAEP